MESKSSTKNSFEGEDSPKMLLEDLRAALEGDESQTRDADLCNMSFGEMSEDQHKYQVPLCHKMSTSSSNEFSLDLERNSNEIQPEETLNSLSIYSGSLPDEYAEDIENIDKVVQSETQNPNLNEVNAKNSKKRNDFAEASMKCLMEKVKLKDSTGSLNTNKSFTVTSGFLNVINGKFNLQQFLDEGLEKIWEMFLKFRTHQTTKKSIEFGIRNCKLCDKCDWRRCPCEICRLEYCMLEFCKWDSFMRHEFKSYIDHLPQIYCLIFVMRRSPIIPRSRFDLLWYVTCQKSIFTCIFSVSNFTEAFRYVKDHKKSKGKPKSDDEIYQESIDFINECIEVLEVLKILISEMKRKAMEKEISEKRVNSMENEIPCCDADESLLKEFNINIFGPESGTKRVTEAKNSYEKIFKEILTFDFSKNKTTYPGGLNAFLKMSLIFISNELKPDTATLFEIFEHHLETAISVGHI